MLQEKLIIFLDIFIPNDKVEKKNLETIALIFP